MALLNKKKPEGLFMVDIKIKELIDGIHRLLNGETSLAGIPNIKDKEVPSIKVLEASFVDILKEVTYREDLYAQHSNGMEGSVKKLPNEKATYDFVKEELDILRKDPDGYHADFKERFNEDMYRKTLLPVASSLSNKNTAMEEGNTPSPVNAPTL